MDIEIRTGAFIENRKNIKLCPHIWIKGREAIDLGNPEYKEHLEIFCLDCSKWHSVIIHVN